MILFWYLFFIFLLNPRFFKALTSKKNNVNSRSRQSDETAVSQLARSLIQEIQSKAPNSLLVAVHVQKALQNAAEELNLPNPENDDCERDYTHLCPLHWLPRGDGYSCSSNIQYTGACQHLVNFSDFSPLKKQKFGIECNVTWPCKAPTCIQDVSAPCPMHFLVQDDGSCLASSSYRGRCVRKISFKNYSHAHRYLWAEICNVFWPCRKPCSDESTSTCPQNWKLSHSKKYCIAPLEYLGPCSPVQPVSMKKEIMTENCGVQYDCNNNVKESKDIESCQQDYTSMCPFEWKISLLNNNICEAPFPYKGPCPLRFSFVNYTMIMKKKFAKACNVYWPCKTSTQQVTIKKSQLKAVSSHAYNESYLESTENTQPLPHVERRNRAHAQLLQKFLLAANQYLPRRISITLQKVIHDLNRREKDAVIMFTVANTSKKTSASSRFIQLLRIARLSVPPISEAHKLLSEINYKEKEKIHPLVQKHLKTTRESHSFHFLETPSTLERLDNFNARIDPYGTHTNHNSRSFLQDKCTRDYTAPCPIGWSLTTAFQSIMSRKLSSCIAPNTFQYQLKCHPVQPFPMMSKQQKQLAEIKCGVVWPCRKCHHDYVRPPCPQGWIHEGNGFCRISPQLLENKLSNLTVRSHWCSSAINFKFMVPELRQLWSKTCGYDWPCFQICERNFSSPCPLYWKQVKDEEASSKHNTVCIPLAHNSIEMHSQPNSFPCGRKLVVPLDILDRYLLESNCNVQWPCQELCTMDFKKPCPYGYTVKPRTGECLPPAFKQALSSLSSNNLCSSSVRFPYWFGTKRKKEFFTLCHAPWPCQNMCDEDFSFACPAHWKLKKEKQQKFCIPNSRYQGPCVLKKYNVTTFTLLSKWEFAWICQGLLFMPRFEQRCAHCLSY